MQSRFVNKLMNEKEKTEQLNKQEEQEKQERKKKWDDLIKVAREKGDFVALV